MKKNRYTAIIEEIFFSHYRSGDREVRFERDEIAKTARKLKIELPKNLGDIIYSFRYRTDLPKKVRLKAGKGNEWLIRPAGRGKYRFCLVPWTRLEPNPDLGDTKVPDSTPGIVAKYALSDEQALLAKVRYNRLIDIFLGVTCYSLQNHLRTSVRGMGQVETDELYVGVEKRGIQYVLPVQAKGGMDRLSVVQIEQDMAVCGAKFPGLICRPIAAQFMKEGVIALFELEQEDNRIAIASEKHYRLVPPDEVTEGDLEKYRARVSD